MSAQRQRPIDFATEGLLLTHRVGRNCGIRVQCLTEELLKRLKGAMVELPQKLPIESKIGPDSGHVVLATLRFFIECLSWRG